MSDVSSSSCQFPWARLNPKGLAKGIVQPRPHQAEDVPRLAALLEAPGSRTQYIAACGTGKTLTGLWTAQCLDARRIMIFFPSLALIDQTMREWEASHDPDRPLEMAALCSLTSGDIPPSACSQPATTDVDDIERFWSAPLAPEKRRVLFVCYNSTAKAEELLAREGAPVPDLLIADEAHHTCGEIDKEAQAILYDEHIPATRRLFMTATPVFTNVDDDLTEDAPATAKRRRRPIAGMDQANLYGLPEVHRGFRWAIDHGILTPYQVTMPDAIDPATARIIERFARAEAEMLNPKERMPKGYWEKAFIVAREMLVHPDGARRIFTFHSKVKHAKQFAAAVQVAAREMGLEEPFVAVLSAEDSVAERKRVLDTLRDSRAGLVASVNVLAEGVDAPAVDGIAMIDPRDSTVKIAQGIGRAIRRDPRRPDKVARIIVPVQARRDGTTEGTMATEGYKTLYLVLKTLGESDERLRAYARAVRLERAGGPAMTQEDRDYFASILNLGGTVGLSNEERNALLRSLETKLVKDFAHTWEDYYRALVAYTERGNTTRPPIGTMEQGLDIGRFVSQQRRRFFTYTDEALAASPEYRLLAAFPWWDLKTDEQLWKEMALRCVEWIRTHDGRMPDYLAPGDTPEAKEERELGTWAKNVKAGRQAALGENKKRTPLPQHRYEFLTRLCPDFQWSLTTAEKERDRAARELEAAARQLTKRLRKLTPEQRKLVIASQSEAMQQALRRSRRTARQAAQHTPTKRPPVPQHEWEPWFQRVEAWVRRERRRPDAIHGPTTEERSLGQWLRSQQFSLEAISGGTELTMKQRTMLALLLSEIDGYEANQQVAASTPSFATSQLAYR